MAYKIKELHDELESHELIGKKIKNSFVENVYVLLGKLVDGDSDNVYIELKLSS